MSAQHTLYTPTQCSVQIKHKCRCTTGVHQSAHYTAHIFRGHFCLLSLSPNKSVVLSDLFCCPNQMKVNTVAFYNHGTLFLTHFFPLVGSTLIIVSISAEGNTTFSNPLSLPLIYPHMPSLSSLPCWHLLLKDPLLFTLAPDSPPLYSSLSLVASSWINSSTVGVFVLVRHVVLFTTLQIQTNLTQKEAGWTEKEESG